GFSVDCFEVNFFVNVNTSKGARKWFTEFEEITKTTMPQTKGNQLQKKKDIFHEIRHCIHSDAVRRKQENPMLKKPNSIFRHVKEDVCKKYIDLFANGHSPASALYTYEDSLYLNAKNDQELMLLLADRAQNPDYGY
ncbi:7364_t:CDS:2, partial [Gigaspora margarita]